MADRQKFALARKRNNALSVAWRYPAYSSLGTPTAPIKAICASLDFRRVKGFALATTDKKPAVL